MHYNSDMQACQPQPTAIPYHAREETMDIEPIITNPDIQFGWPRYRLDGATFPYHGDPGVQFDGVNYRRATDGAVVPSVAQILAPLRRQLYERHTSRTQAASVDMLAAEILDGMVHEALRDDEQERLAEDALFGDVRGCLAAWRAFRHDNASSMDIIHAHITVHHTRLHYAGMVDYVIQWFGIPGILQVTTDADDIVERLYPLYTVALRAGYRASGYWPAEVPLSRWTLQLRPDGRYTVRDHIARANLGRQWLAFHAAMELYNWTKEIMK